MSIWASDTQCGLLLIILLHSSASIPAIAKYMRYGLALECACQRYTLL